MSVGYGVRFSVGAFSRGFRLWILVLCFGFEEMFGAHFEVSYWVIGGLWVEELVWLGFEFRALNLRNYEMAVRKRFGFGLGFCSG